MNPKASTHLWKPMAYVACAQLVCVLLIAATDWPGLAVALSFWLGVFCPRGFFRRDK